MTTSLIARTGRVQNWMDDPTGRLPVSCTVFVVENELSGPEGLEASWRYASHGLRYGAGVAIHLTKLDPKGTVRPSGVTASGPVSFGKIYSSLNEVIRRGGRWKNGAIVLHLDLSHPDALEFITASRQELPWVKRCINVTDAWWRDCNVAISRCRDWASTPQDIRSHRFDFLVDHDGFCLARCHQI